MADVINNRWVLDATFRGHYAADTMEAATSWPHIAGGELDVRDEDIAALTAALPTTIAWASTPTSAGSCVPPKAKTTSTTMAPATTRALALVPQGRGRVMRAKAYPPPIGTGSSIPRACTTCCSALRTITPTTKKIYITENGMGYKDDFEDGFIDDAPRIDYMRQHLAWILKAIDGGVNVDLLLCGRCRTSSPGPTAITNVTACSTSTLRPEALSQGERVLVQETSRRPACSWPSFSHIPCRPHVNPPTGSHAAFFSRGSAAVCLNL